jgi:hypothetical protein
VWWYIGEGEERTIRTGPYSCRYESISIMFIDDAVIWMTDGSMLHLEI